MAVVLGRFVKYITRVNSSDSPEFSRSTKGNSKLHENASFELNWRASLRITYLSFILNAFVILSFFRNLKSLKITLYNKDLVSSISPFTMPKKCTDCNRTHQNVPFELIFFQNRRNDVIVTGLSHRNLKFVTLGISRFKTDANWKRNISLFFLRNSLRKKEINQYVDYFSAYLPILAALTASSVVQIFRDFKQCVEHLKGQVELKGFNCHNVEYM